MELGVHFILWLSVALSAAQPYISEMLFQQNAHHMYSESNKYYGCVIPKVGCSSWLHYLKTQHGMRGLDKPLFQDLYSRTTSNATELSFFTPHKWDDAAHILYNKAYFKWVVVRHPWNRLISAYRSKYVYDCNKQSECMANTYKLTVPSAASFAVFVEALYRSINTLHTNAHFAPMHILCNIGIIPYDYIADLTNTTETNYISTKIGFATPFAQAKQVHTAQLLETNPSKHHSIECTARTVFLVERMYAADSALLGYTYQHLYAACSNNTSHMQ